MRKKEDPVNLFELKPSPLTAGETGDRGDVVLLVPRFQNRFMVRWVSSRLRSPHMRVKLDAFGSFVWRQCDGRTTVAEIADRMKKEFGESAGQADDRVAAFLVKLHKSDLINLYPRESEIRNS